MNRPDLIDQLNQLTPTPGEWNNKILVLAPQMRTAILDMAKEIEGLEEENRKLQFIIDNGLGERDLTNDI